MSEHTRISGLLPEYAAGGLDLERRAEIESHLSRCTECQADLELWKSISMEIIANDQAVPAPRGLADRALSQAKLPTSPAVLRRTHSVVQLLRSQIPLIRREIWPASASVIGLGFIAAIIAAEAGFIYAVAPLIAAACVSLIYGPENDPMFELSLSTPTSPRQILLARLVLVFGYNLGLVAVATLGMLPVIQNPLTIQLILNWLAPMVFLSATALLLSIWVGAQNAIALTYLAWLLHIFTGLQQTVGRVSPVLTNLVTAYQEFWKSPGLMLALSIGLIAAAVYLAGRLNRLGNQDLTGSV
jgi:hypothetical protein